MIARRRVSGGSLSVLVFQLREPRFETGDLVEQAVQRSGDRVRYVLAYSVRLKNRLGTGLPLAVAERARPDADHSRVVRNFRLDERLRADASSVADAERAENLRMRADDDAVSQGRVPLRAACQRCAAERHTLVKGDVIADLGGLADDDTHPMIDEDAPADACAGMDLDAGQNAAGMRYETPREEPAVLPQPVGNTVVNEGVKPGIAQNHFEARPRGGVAGEGRIYFFPKVFQKHRYHYLC